MTEAAREALLDIAKETFAADDEAEQITDELLCQLWDRGFKIVPLSDEDVETEWRGRIGAMGELSRCCNGDDARAVPRSPWPLRLVTARGDSDGDAA